LQKVITFIATVAVLGLALMFSAALLTVLPIVGAIGGARLWWKTREMRRQMREMQQTMQDFLTRNADRAGDVFRGKRLRV
jgi:Flp pilus assembly protein TadB